MMKVWGTLLGILIATAVLALFPYFHRHDCYDWHVYECEQCHKEGLGFLYCSGFCVNESETPMPAKPYDCYVALNESCEEEVPHGCVLPENEYIDGICLGITDICWIWG